MNRLSRFLLVMTAVGVFVSSGCEAGSIYAKRNKNMRTFYSDDVARQLGDTLTVIIVEDHKTDNTIERDLESTHKRSTSFNGELGIGTPDHHLIPRMPGFTMSAESSRTQEGQSDYKDERSIEDSIAVIVEDVQPNGNLVVIGRRERNIAGDTQTIKISGIVNPRDINFNNTVLSSQIANFTIVTENDGYSEDYNKPGWLAQLFDIIWPF